ncbi:uncharacterized protein CEXT_180371 [Caerostris extrusa]|uniref:RNase H type-1 domain-containing protein n=1 Tax=Caerostris extrusa TaxID=172846 RepID=A0AAV4XXT6_CAEEX|nr:uncharacterized protein CEXT_180371 [Caerostris extrusa]
MGGTSLENRRSKGWWHKTGAFRLFTSVVPSIHTETTPFLTLLFTSPPWNRFKISWQHFDHDISGLSIYTDGSKFNNNTGCALVVFRDGIEVHHLLCKLNPEATVFLAELKAIEMAVNLVVSQSMVNAEIISDSRAHVDTAGNEAADAYAKLSVGNDSIDCKLELPKAILKIFLQQDTLQQWQVGWNSSLKGRAVFDLCPKVHLKRLHGNFYINQLITGHGALAQYQGKFFGKDDFCSCGKAVEDRLHLVFHCKRWQGLRDKWFSA